MHARSSKRPCFLAVLWTAAGSRVQDSPGQWQLCKLGGGRLRRHCQCARAISASALHACCNVPVQPRPPCRQAAPAFVGLGACAGVRRLHVAEVLSYRRLAWAARRWRVDEKCAWTAPRLPSLIPVPVTKIRPRSTLGSPARSHGERSPPPRRRHAATTRPDLHRSEEVAAGGSERCRGAAAPIAVG